MMEYKGYVGKVEFDDEAGIFHGEVLDTRDVITFQGQSVDELQKAFQESIDDYLAFCEERGEEPNKPFSGQFVTRIPPELHRQVNLAASISGKEPECLGFGASSRSSCPYQIAKASEDGQRKEQAKEGSGGFCQGESETDEATCLIRPAATRDVDPHRREPCDFTIGKENGKNLVKILAMRPLGEYNTSEGFARCKPILFLNLQHQSNITAI